MFVDINSYEKQALAILK